MAIERNSRRSSRGRLSAESRLLVGVITLWIFTLSCGFLSGEDTGEANEAITSCGTPIKLSVTVSGGGTQTSANPLSTSTQLVIPAEIMLNPNATLLMGAAGGTITGILTFSGAKVCTYSTSLPVTPNPTIPAPPLAWVSCSAGLAPGQTLYTTSVTLKGHTPTQEDQVITETATLPIGIDDGNPCTADTCSSGSVLHMSITNAQVPDGNVCNGIEYCDGSGIFHAGTPLTITDSNPCVTTTCDAQAGIITTYNTTSGCASTLSPNTYPGGGAVPNPIGYGMTFLYNGGPQTGLTATMDMSRISVLRGRVIDRATGAPITGQVVTVTVVNHPEYGQTTTQSNGWFDLAVNGGQSYALQISSSGYVTSQRHGEARWLDWTVVSDTALVAKDTKTTSVTTNAVNWQVAQGNPVTTLQDPDGSRTATILFPPGTVVTNSGFSPSTLTVRATELGVGSLGTKAMPAELPPQSAYTYAIELGIDEAYTAGINTVTFNQPVFFYVDNFVGLPLDASNVLHSVPTGSYDRTRGTWQTETAAVGTSNVKGKVLCIFGSSGGLAQISLDCGTTEISYAAFGITSGERTTLASTYTSYPKQVWRVPLAHFSPWDLNGGAWPPNDAIPPPNITPIADTPRDKGCDISGSIIECENQALGEDVPIANTPFSLHYRSATQNGYHPTITVPITDTRTIPSDLDHIEVEIDVAGQQHILSIPHSSITTSQTIPWVWDRTDAYGRAVAASVTAQVYVRYYFLPSSSTAMKDFADFGTQTIITGGRSQRVVVFTKSYSIPINVFDDKALSLGGWTLNVQHVFESTGALWLGDGRQRTPAQQAHTLTTTWQDNTTTGAAAVSLAMMADGSFAVAQHGINVPDQVVLKVQGGASTVLSATNTGATNFSDGAFLASVFFDGNAIAAGPDNSVIVSGMCRIARVDNWQSSSPTVTLLAGRRVDDACASNAFSADGAAIDMPLNKIRAMALAPDGAIIFAEQFQNGIASALRKVRPDHYVETLSTIGPHGGYVGLSGVATAPDGSVFFGDESGFRVYRIGIDGVVSDFAGTGVSPGICGGSLGDGGPATSAPVYAQGLAWRAGALVLAGNTTESVRLVDATGTITTVAGLSNHCSGTAYYEGAIATATALHQPVAVTVGWDANIYAIDSGNGSSYSVITRINLPKDIASGTSMLVADPDGGDPIYQFDNSNASQTNSTQGRIQAVLTRYRGQTRFTFGYDSSGRLSTVTDLGGNVTVLAYPTSTTVTITAPIGKPSSSSPTPTTLTLDATTKYLTAIANPNGETHHVVHGSSGLLTQFTDPNGNVHTFAYTPTGLLTKDHNPLTTTANGTLLGRTPSLPLVGRSDGRHS